MRRLIDAEALKDDILKSAVMIDDRGIQTGYEIAVELIKRQPTVDAVPVIRCKDCEFYSTYRILKTTERLCNQAAGLVEPRPRGHCNYAKRRKI